MRKICRRQYLRLWLITLLASPLPLFAQVVESADPIDELIVTTHRRAQPVLSHAGNIERLDSDSITRTRHQHIHELLTQVSGVWLGRASGQEHLTAIRSPILTGAGSCGSFLFLEDGIPIRPSGFCNVNSLFEINTEQAESIEVIRGPGSALYGSNALHGVINVLMPLPGENHTPQLAFEFGANNFYRASANLPFDDDASWLASMVYANDGGFRDDSGYQQSKLHVKRQWDPLDGNFTLAFSATDLDQDTAGFIQGEDAYKDSSLNRGNLNPEAIRNASSQRLYGIWTRSLKRFELEVRPFLRRSDMRFLQHFLPGQPLEENGHISSGALASATFSAARYLAIVGVDLEWSDLFLKQTQDGAIRGMTERYVASVAACIRARLIVRTVLPILHQSLRSTFCSTHKPACMRTCRGDFVHRRQPSCTDCKVASRLLILIQSDLTVSRLAYVPTDEAGLPI
jgi:hypothetical protein